MLFITFIYILKILIIVVPLLISVAYFTLAERKIMGSIQRRPTADADIRWARLRRKLSEGSEAARSSNVLMNALGYSLRLLAARTWFLACGCIFSSSSYCQSGYVRLAWSLIPLRWRRSSAPWVSSSSPVCYFDPASDAFSYALVNSSALI